MAKVKTATLLSAAAIAVISGIIFVATGPLHAVIIAINPALYGLIIGIYFLPAAIAQSLYQLPGIALLVTALSGLLAAISPLQPIAWAAMLWIMLIGLFQELPFTVTGYKIWKPWLSYLGALVAGVFLAIGFNFAFKISTLGLGLQILQFVVTTISPLIWTFIGRALAKAVKKTGAIR